jgi:hypothetical protein
MKKFKMKMLLNCGLAMALCIGTTEISLAQGFGVLNSLKGKGGSETVDINSLEEKQSELSNRLQAALTEITGAQLHFANALGDKEQSDQLRATIDSLSKGSTNVETLSDTVIVSGNIGKKQGELFSKMSNLNDQQKKEIQKGLIPYSKGTAHTILLGKEFGEHLKATQGALSKGSVANIAQIKNKLGLTLSLAPKMPGLGSTHVETATTLIKMAKSNKLKTDEADKALAKLEL